MRLGPNRQYQYIYRRGRKYNGRNIVLVYMRGAGIKVGFSVSSKVGNSVTRNRLRRRMKEDFRHMLPELRPGRYIFIARVSARERNAREMKDDMAAIIKKAELFKA